EETVKALGIKTRFAEDPRQHPLYRLFDLMPRARRLELKGSLGFNTDKLARINSLFTGQVKKIEEIDAQEPDEMGKPRSVRRPLAYLDEVKEGQLLAVLASKDLGQMKSQLIGAAAQLRIDNERYQNLQALLLRGSIPEQSVRDAKQKVETDIVALESARN